MRRRPLIPGHSLLLGLFRAAVLAGLLAAVAEVAAADVSFRLDVMAVLSKAGCNLGTCHGSLTGKNGFRLSLRGQDPAEDHVALARQQFARRANLLDPDASLILTKPTGQVPHEGGRRFDVDSAEYRILRDWIAAGMPDDGPTAAVVERLVVAPADVVLVEPEDHVELRVEAHLSDGEIRDVTPLAVYESATNVARVSYTGRLERERLGETSVVVRYLDQQATLSVAFIPDRPAPFRVQNEIDRHVLAKLERLRQRPSDAAPEHVFLRRAYLDLLGVLPTIDETRAYLADDAPDRRGRLIDELLERPEYAEQWARKWSDLLRNEEKQLDRKGVETFHHWIRQSFEQGKPLDQFAAELIAARGSTYTSPAANYHRALRDPHTAAEATAQVFLGVRLQCARCHNHPFDRWTQDDYASFSAFFARVRYEIVENNRRDRFDLHEFDGEQVVWMARQGEVKNPRTGQPARPQFPQDDVAQEASDVPLDGDRLEALAEWLTGPGREWFARVQANRVWYHLLGRGVVDPIDDFRTSNPPINAALLDELTAEFLARDCDVRSLIRLIMNSQTYQLSAVPNETNDDDEQNFGRALVRPLEAEVLLDAMAAVLDTAPKFNGYPQGLRAGQVAGVSAFRPRERAPSAGDQFLRLFGKPQRLLSCECERPDEPTLAQAFQLINGPVVAALLEAEGNRIDRLLAAGAIDEAIIEEFYLAALCRAPSLEEQQAALAHLSAADDRRAAIEDLVWALVSSKEFLLRH